MMLNKELGRYHFVWNKWLRFFVRTPKTTEGWEAQFEIGRLYRGPGIWWIGGEHRNLTLWLSSDKSLDITQICGKCALCTKLYKTPPGKSRLKVHRSWK